MNDNKFMKIGDHILNAQKILGYGRVSTVYECSEAADLITWPMAVKVYKLPLGENSLQGAREIVEKEIDMLKRYKPDGFAEVLSFQRSANSLYCISKRYDSDLKQELTKRGALTRGEVDELAKTLLSSIYFLHTLGVVHQDLKPSGKFYLTDFGSGGKIEMIEGRGIWDIYISPQRLFNQPFTAKCDVWSFGALLHVALFGSVPSFNKEKTLFPSELNHQDDLQDLLQKCLQYHESDRLDWEGVYSSNYVVNLLQQRVHIEHEQGFEDICTQVCQLIEQVDLGILFGLNSKKDSMEELKKDEFIAGIKKSMYNISRRNVEDLYCQIVGVSSRVIRTSDFKKWIEIKRSIKPLQKLNQVQQIRWNQNQRIKKKHLLCPSVIKLILNMKNYFLNSNLSLDQLYEVYDPLNDGGISQEQYSLLLKRVEPYGVDKSSSDAVFQFINQSDSGRIQKSEFMFIVLDTNYQLLSART